MDKVVISLAYHEVNNAIYIMETLYKSARAYMLEDELTREQKKALKEDLGFTQTAVMALSQAKQAYQKLTKSLAVVGNELDGRLHTADYDYAQGDSRELLALDIAYINITNGKPEVEKKIQDFIRTFEMDDGVREVFETQLRHASYLKKQEKI